MTDEQQGGYGNAGNAHRHGRTHPHDGCPEHNAKHSHSLMRESRKWRQNCPEQEKQAPGKDKAREDIGGLVPLSHNVFNHILPE